MKSAHLYELVEKYFSGSTSLEEEKELRMTFSKPKDEIPQDLHVYIPMFSWTDEVEDTLDDLFAEKIWDSIETGKIGQAKVRSISGPIKLLLGVAASLIFMIGVFNWNAKPSTDKTFAWHKKQDMSTEEAYRLTQNALAVISFKMNKGKDPIKHIGSFSKVQTLIKSQKR